MGLPITPTMYREHNKSCDLDDSELERVLETAWQTVYVHTCGRLDFYDELPDNVKENVLRSIMAQADYISANFGADISECLPESMSVGSFSYSMGSGETVSSPSALCDTARMYLQFTGLTYRGDIGAI